MALLDTHHTITAGIAPGHRPTASMAATLSKKLQLDLGREVVVIALGDTPAASLAALRGDLDALLHSEAS